MDPAFAENPTFLLDLICLHLHWVHAEQYTIRSQICIGYRYSKKTNNWRHVKSAMILVFLELSSCQPATVERESLLGLVLGHSMSSSLQCYQYHVKNKRLKTDNQGNSPRSFIPWNERNWWMPCTDPHSDQVVQTMSSWILSKW